MGSTSVLLLLFEIGGVRYGLDSREVLAVVADELDRTLIGAPPGIAGLLLHAGEPIPVIDVSSVVTGTPAARRLSTRIVIVPYPQGAAGARIGLRLERANDAVRLDPAAFRDIGVTAADAPCLGPVAALGDGGWVQRVEAAALLTPALQASLQSALQSEASA